MAKVSIVMPAYNVAPYVGAAIDSVIAQTVRDWELIVVDDGSSDGTGAVLERFAAGDPRIRHLFQANAGISAARNRALGEASGEVIALLDSDDLWTPSYLEEQMAILSDRPELDVVTGNGWFFGGRFNGQTARPCPDERPQPTLAAMLEDESSIFIMSVMRRRVYEAIGGFDTTLQTNEDYDFWLRAAIAGFRFQRNDTPLGYYRRRDDSMSASEARMLCGILRVYRKLRPLLLDRPAELRILDAQVVRFEREALAAQARQALTSGDVTVAAGHLSALYAHSGGAAVGVASFMARRMPWLLSRAYQLRRAYQGVSS